MTDTASTAAAADARPIGPPHAAPLARRAAARDAAIVFALAALPLLATLGGGFVADDFFFVTILERITQPVTAYVAGAVLAMRDVPTSFYRPLAMTSLLVDLRASGSDPRVLHAVNLALHALTAVAVWGIARRILTGPAARAAAVVAALAWAWFPRRVETVAWISCRPDLLATALGTLGLWLWIEGAGGRRMTLRTAGVFAWGLALLAKESAVVLPLALLAWPGTGAAASDASTHGRCARVAARATALWPFAVTLGGYFALRRLALGTFVGGYGASTLVFWSDSTLKHLIYPAIPPVEWLNRWLLAPGVLLPAAVIVGGMTMALWFAIWRTRTTPAVAFGALWWLAGALPAMPFLPSLSTTFNDRLMYLSGIGLALIVGGWWTCGGRRLRTTIAAGLLLATWQTMTIAARWPVAGTLAARLVSGVAGAMKAGDPAQPVIVAAVPDSYLGAYVLRNALEYAIQREGVLDPARVAVASHYLLESPSAMPVEVTAEGPANVRLRGKGGRPEVMADADVALRFATLDAAPTHDRYGRRVDVLIRLNDPALVLVAAPGGVRSLGVIGTAIPHDSQASPRVGPRE